MPITQLQHINIRCTDADLSRDFYRALGLKVGPRPPFPFPGYWLYAGDDAVIHLVQRPAGEAAQGPGTGDLDHVALAGSDLQAMRRILEERGLAFREALVPRDKVTQLFVADPDGVMLELNFPPEP